ncbi:MAG: CPBP family intramembrane metalloprotease [Desulfobacteraceae bacterium]|nr:CPBP family intramembrane metalloprotease [Desulfobacteraceae bacterium]
METRPVEYGLKPFALVFVAVIALEAGSGFFCKDPLIVAGIVRILDAAVIAGAAMVFGYKARLPGIIPADVKKGIVRGVFWAAGFGCIVTIFGGLLYAAGFSPAEMIRVSLPQTSGRLFAFFVFGGIVSPFAEELIFRGAVFGLMRRWGAAPAVLGSALLFALAHNTAGLPVLQAVGGLVFALSYEAEKNLLVPVIIHVTGNLALFLLALL